MKRYSLLVLTVLIAILVSACGGAATADFSASGDKPRAALVEFTGVIEAIDGNQWTINGQVITVDPTVLRDGSYKVGDTVKVEAEVQADGTVVVTRVESDDDDNSNDDNSNDDNGNDDDSNDDNSNDDNGNDDNSNDDDDNGNDDNSNDDDNGNDDDSNDDNSNDDDNGNDDDSNDDSSNDDDDNDDDSSDDSGDDDNGNDD